MLQERIRRPRHRCVRLLSRGRAVALFSHRRLRERPPWGGVSVLSESIALCPDARDYAHSLLDDLGWHGVAMVEFKRDARDGVPKLMEINGRFWGSLQLAIDAGVDFPGAAGRGASATGRASTAPPIASAFATDGSGATSTPLLLTLFATGWPAGAGPNGARAGALRFHEVCGVGTSTTTIRSAHDLRPWLFESGSWFAAGASLATSVHASSIGQRPPTPAFGRSRAEQAAASAPGSSARSTRSDSTRRRVECAGRASDTNSIFQTHEWTRSWWQRFGRPVQPCSSSCLGALRLPWRCAAVIDANDLDGTGSCGFLGDGRSDYCDFLTARQAEPGSWRRCSRRSARPGWDLIELNNIPAQSRTAAIVRTICARGRLPQPRRRIISSARRSSSRGREASVRDIFNKPSLRRRQNYFERAGRADVSRPDRRGGHRAVPASGSSISTSRGGRHGDPEPVSERRQPDVLP